MTDLHLKLANVIRQIRTALPKFEGDWSMVHMPVDGYHLYQKVNNNLSHYGPFTEGQLVPLMRGMAILKQPWQDCHTFIETRNLVSGGILEIPESPVPDTHKFLALTKKLGHKFGTDRLYTRCINDICASNWHREQRKNSLRIVDTEIRDTYSEDI